MREQRRSNEITTHSSGAGQGSCAQQLDKFAPGVTWICETRSSNSLQVGDHELVEVPLAILHLSRCFPVFVKARGRGARPLTARTVLHGRGRLSEPTPAALPPR